MFRKENATIDMVLLKYIIFLFIGFLKYWNVIFHKILQNTKGAIFEFYINRFWFYKI